MTSSFQTHLRQRRRSSAPDVSRGLLLLSPWEPAPAPEAALPDSPWADVTLKCSDDDVSPHSNSSPVFRLRRRSSAPGSNFVYNIWGAGEKLLEKKKSSEIKDEADFFREDAKVIAQRTSRQFSSRKFSTGRSIDLEAFEMEDSFDEAYRHPGSGSRTSRRYSSRSSRSKSADLSSSL